MLIRSESNHNIADSLEGRPVLYTILPVSLCYHYDVPILALKYVGAVISTLEEIAGSVQN
jgi:hypothetical protein